MVGNSVTFTEARKGNELWDNLMGMLQDGHHVYNGFPVMCERHPDKKILIEGPEDFTEKVPDGGCLEPWQVPTTFPFVNC